MTIQLRSGFAALALLASTAAANAQSSTTPQPAAQLTPTQRSAIYQRVVGALPPAAPETHANIAVGDRVPNTIPLYEMPDPSAAELPGAKRYRYMVVNNELMVVDPETNTVVEIHRQ